ncbi:MAG: calcium-binding protein [Qipengyuania pacifica]
MIEVKSSKKAKTPGTARLEDMVSLRETVSAIPKRKIGMGVTVMFALIAYIKPLFGGSEVAAQATPDTPLGAADNAAPICETDNLSANNSGRMSYGNAELFRTSDRSGQDGGFDATTFERGPNSSVLLPADLSLEKFQAPNITAAAVNLQPTFAPANPGGGGEDGLFPDTDIPAGGGGPADPGGGGTEITSPLQEDADPEQEEDDDNLPGVDDDGEGPFEGPVVEDEELEEADAEEPKDEDAEPEEEKHESDADVDCHDTAAADCGDKVDHSDGPNPDEEASCDDAKVDECWPESCDQHNAADDDCLDDPVTPRGDVVYGFDTPDHISGSEDNDLVYGGDGSDVLLGYGGDDFLIGAAGDDTIDGGEGDDRISGGHGEDLLAGGAGDDILSGGADDDVLRDGHGADRLFGDAGNDTIYLADDLEADQVYGGAGDDILDLTAGDRAARVDVAAGTVTRADSPTDTFDGIEIFTAGDGAEVFDLSGFFTPGATSVSETVFQIRNFGHDDTLVFADDIRLALSDLQQIDDRRDIKNDGSDFEARITSFDPEAAAEEHGRPGFRQGDQDELMVRRIDLRLEQETDVTEIELWVTSDLGNKQSDDFTS